MVLYSIRPREAEERWLAEPGLVEEVGGLPKAQGGGADEGKCGN